MCVGMYIIYACIYLCTCVFICRSMHVFIDCVCMYECMHAHMFTSVCVHLYWSMLLHCGSVVTAKRQHCHLVVRDVSLFIGLLMSEYP